MRASQRERGSPEYYAEINRAIALPAGKLMTEDGREIGIREWTTTVPLNGVIEVTIKGIISVDGKGLVED